MWFLYRLTTYCAIIGIPQETAENLDIRGYKNYSNSENSPLKVSISVFRRSYFAILCKMKLLARVDLVTYLWDDLKKNFQDHPFKEYLEGIVKLFKKYAKNNPKEKKLERKHSKPTMQFLSLFL